MAQTPSTMQMSLGAPAPHFRLPDPSGRLVSLDDFPGARAYLVMFICNHCPFVKHIRDELARLGREYSAKNVAIVAISSNDIERYPQDSPPRMAEEAAAAGYTFPYLFDEEQSVAKAFAAACTPDFYVFDQKRRLVYRGQLDDSRPLGKSAGTAVAVSGADLRAALDACISGTPVSSQQRPSIGCNIKWKPGNEPEYFRNPA